MTEVLLVGGCMDGEMIENPNKRYLVLRVHENPEFCVPQHPTESSPAEHAVIRTRETGYRLERIVVDNEVFPIYVAREISLTDLVRRLINNYKPS